VLPELALFDARDRKSYDLSHVDGAERLHEQGLHRALQEVPKRTPIVVYCYHGHASQTYAAMFADVRFAEVYSVDGGYETLAGALAAQERLAREERTGGDVSEALASFLHLHAFDSHQLNAPREHGLTPLMRAALAGRADLVDELLSLGADANRRNTDGNAALWLACVSNDVPTVQRLVEAGVEVDGRNDTGATALMYAASTGKDRVVALLLRAGASKTVQNQDDFTAVDLASTRECLELLHRPARA
jgi:rhodanese-related sulfurtransferase